MSQLTSPKPNTSIKSAKCGVKYSSIGPKEVAMPDYFAERLAVNAQVKAVFDSKPPSFRKEYLLWITDAKTEGTRQK